MAGGGRPGGGRPGADAGRSAGGGTGGTPRRAASREEIEQRAYDPRREERRKASRVPLPDDVDPRMLDPEARRELRTLARETADLVARHLVVVGRLLDDDPEQALVHARAARAMAGRVGVVREAAGLAAYAAGEWAEALSELRTARRITGEAGHLAVLADCERALGRPERALAYADDPDVARLSQDERVELVIVLSGARRDLGQADAAVLTLQDPARRTTEKRPWAARLWYAYADALLAAGRAEQAREWFAKAAQVDVDGTTDAGDRLLELDGVVLEDLGDDGNGEDEGEQEAGGGPDAAELKALADAVVVAQQAAVPPAQGASAAGADEAGSHGSGPVEVEPVEQVAAAPEVRERVAPPSGVLPPMFAEPVVPPASDAPRDGGELRLFD